MTPLQIAADVSARLDARGIRHLIGGSFASSAWGELRATNDVDIAVMVSDDQAMKLVEVFSEPYHISPEAVERAINEPGSYRMAHAKQVEESFSIDLFLVRPDEYTLTEFARAARLEIVPGSLVPFAAPENIVLQKLRWYDAGNRISDRQWNDIIRILDNQREALDYAYLRRWAIKLGVDSLLDQALDDRTSEDPFA